MGVLPLDLQAVGTIRRDPREFSIYWKKETKEVYVFHEGMPIIQPDGPIRETLTFLIGVPLHVACCAVYEADGSPSVPMNEPNDLLECNWSDFACDRLLIQARLF